MCKVSRRELLLGSAALLTSAASDPKAVVKASPVEVGKVDPIADGVYFHQGNILVGHCNTGWIIFED